MWQVKGVGGGVVFCPALGEAGATTGRGEGGDAGRGDGSIWGGGYKEAVLASLEGVVGLPGAQGSAMSQVDDPEGLFSQLEEVAFQGFT